MFCFSMFYYGHIRLMNKDGFYHFATNICRKFDNSDFHTKINISTSATSFRHGQCPYYQEMCKTKLNCYLTCANFYLIYRSALLHPSRQK